MILRFRVFGFEVWRLELITDDEAEEEEAAAIGGSSTHDFERDPYPPHRRNTMGRQAIRIHIQILG